MKILRLLGLVAFPALPPLAGAQSVQSPQNASAVLEVGVLPGQRIPVELEPKERNPFARREVKAAEPVVETESEESKLRAIFQGMTITGVIRGGGPTKVLLEGLILKPGAPVPALLDGQTEQLVVGRITDRQVELNFVEADPQAAPRRIFLRLDLRPRVAVRMRSFPEIEKSETPGPMRAPADGAAPPEGVE